MTRSMVTLVRWLLVNPTTKVHMENIGFILQFENSKKIRLGTLIKCFVPIVNFTMTDSIITIVRLFNNIWVI